MRRRATRRLVRSARRGPEAGDWLVRDALAALRFVDGTPRPVPSVREATVVAQALAR
ncbi:MAG: hypothetical protein K0R38_6667 [Polyangiaceae bacterium]|nr:hypothetical protein [Polyangiaceae bacterium]